MPLFLFTWDEDYLLLQELAKRKSWFIEKYWTYGLFDFACDALDPEQLQNALMGWGMFATKKLVIIRGIPLDSTSHNKAKTADIDRCLSLLEKYMTTNDPQTIIVCISYHPDKRTKPYKRFVNNADIREFPFLDEKQKINYVHQQVGTLLNDTQIAELTINCWDNLWHLSHECNKLYHYAVFHKITSFTDEQFRSIIWSSIASNNFALLDHLYTDTKKSLELITIAQQAWEETFQFLGMVYRWLKTTISIINLTEQWISDGKTLASKLKIHPFVISKQLKLLPQTKAKKEKIYQLYNDILQLDYEIKTWILPVEWFRLAIKQAREKMWS